MKPRLLNPDHNCQGSSVSNINPFGLHVVVYAINIHLFFQLANCAYFRMKLQKDFFYQSTHNLNRAVSFYKGSTLYIPASRKTGTSLCH